MELALSLGNTTKTTSVTPVGFCMGSSSTPEVTVAVTRSTAEKGGEDQQKTIFRDDDGGVGDEEEDEEEKRLEKMGSSSSSDPTADVSPRQLDLLPFSPVPRPSSTLPSPPLRFPWLSDNLSSEPGSSDGGPGSRIVEVNRRVTVGTTAEEGEEQSSPNSGTSSFMEFSLYTSSNGCGGVKRREMSSNNNNNNKKEVGGVNGVTTSRGSDDDENGSTRKKLRLSKEQSAFLEESFKEHHTLNPKQKLALAKQLNLRARQVEVWFQNRRARTKLKQTEVDCEYLKRCCETLTEENRRLQKELQELRALKTSQPFFMHLPPTTLTMCPSCERVVPTSASALPPVNASTAKPAIPTASAGPATGEVPAASTSSSVVTLSLGKPKPMLPFTNNAQAHKAAS